MSARPLKVTMHQARTLLRAANAERGQVEVEVDGVVFRLIPEVLVREKAGAALQVDQKHKGHL